VPGFLLSSTSVSEVRRSDRTCGTGARLPAGNLLTDSAGQWHKAFIGFASDGRTRPRAPAKPRLRTRAGPRGCIGSLRPVLGPPRRRKSLSPT